MDAFEPGPDALGGVLDLLASCPAFTGTEPDRLAALARAAEIVYAPVDGTHEPELSTRCLVVKRGALGVIDEAGHTIDLVAAGEFHAPVEGCSVRPWEDSLVVLLPPSAASLAWSAGPDALRDAPPTVAGDLRTAQVRTIMRRPLLTADPGESCHAAAARMRAHGVSSLVLLRGDEAGIVTDRDLRNRLVAEGLPGDLPVERIATFPVRAVDSATPVFEVLVEMLSVGVHHLPVAERGRLVGMVSAGDLLQLDGRSALHLRTALDRARDVEEVGDARRQVHATVRALLAAGSGGTDAARVVAAVTDRVVARLLELTTEALGPAPAPFAWLALGSHARREQTLFSDQDTGICYEDGAPDDWFAQLGARMTDALERCGFPRCPGGVMAESSDWRTDVSTWRGRVRGWIDTPTGGNLLALQIGFDLRRVRGSLDVGAALSPEMARAAGRDLFLAHLARASLRHRPPLGFRGRMVVERSGEHEGTFDVKAGAILPIVDLARVHALAAGSTALATGDRLADAVGAGQLSDDLAATLREGYDLALRVRLGLHLDQIDRGEAPSNHLDPSTLTPLVRSQLRETFKAVRAAQEALGARYHTGMLG